MARSEALYIDSLRDSGNSVDSSGHICPADATIAGAYFSFIWLSLSGFHNVLQIEANALSLLWTYRALSWMLVCFAYAVSMHAIRAKLNY